MRAPRYGSVDPWWPGRSLSSLLFSFWILFSTVRFANRALAKVEPGLYPRAAPGTSWHNTPLKRRTVPDSTQYDTRFANVTWDKDNWQLTTKDLVQGVFEYRAHLANGYLGLNVAALGPFFEVDAPFNDSTVIEGWPIFNRRQTFAGISGFWDYQPTTNGSNFPWLDQYGGESVIAGIPHWGGLILELADGEYLGSDTDNSTISNFASTLDMKNGIIYWSLTWSPANSTGLELHIEYSLFIHKLYINQGVVQMQITPSANVNGTVADVLDGTAAVRTDFVKSQFVQNDSSIWTAVRPNGISNVTAYLYSTLDASGSYEGSVNMSSRAIVGNKPYIGANDSSIAQAVNVSLIMGETTVLTKYIGAASTDAFANPQSVAQNASLFGRQTGYEQLLQIHANEWAVTMPDDSVDDYSYPGNGSLPSDPNVIELSITAVTNIYYLLQNTVGANALMLANVTNLDSNGISVCGLANDCYAGMLFWDQDVWMAPGLMLSHPQAAKQIANYRIAKFPQAKANIGMAYSSSQNETGKFSSDAAVYPWTSARFGNCTGTGPCFDYEYHINGDIALSLLDYWIVTGDTDWFRSQAFPVYNAVAVFYSELLDYNRTSGQWVLTNMTDPDEYANGVDNGAYTMALIGSTLTNANSFRQMFNMSTNNTFMQQVQNLAIPTDSGAGIIAEYTGMNGSISVKQADVVLITYPLDYTASYNSSESEDDLDYYAGHQTQDGPGMTYSTFSIIANEASTSGCSAYTYDLYASQPYTRAPWFQFSEQMIDYYNLNGGTNPAYPFLTGHGGDNQVNVYGWLGLRLMLGKLNIDPSLPPQIPVLKYRTIYYQGWPISAFANQTHTTLTRLGSPLSDANMMYANTSIPIQVADNNSTTLGLAPNSSISVSNHDSFSVATVQGNIAQCLPATSPQDYEPGQFPLSAVDGASSTRWQPNSPNDTASLTVDLSNVPFQKVTGFALDWAQNPPTAFSIGFSNTSGVPGTSVYNSSRVTISNPYNTTLAGLVTPYASNTTNVSLATPVWSGRYVTLNITGNQGGPGNNDEGATVAEFAVLGSSSGSGNATQAAKRKRDLKPRSNVMDIKGKRNFGRVLGKRYRPGSFWPER